MSDESTTIISFDFSPAGREEMLEYPMSKDWPVVYLINNEEELYIGETSSISKRFTDHIRNHERRNLKIMNVVFDDQFNKSAILDIENSLIRLCSTDKKFKLQNANSGQSVTHDYFQRGMYQAKIEYIWGLLKEHGLVKNEYRSLINTDIFKFSPYTSLTEEQDEACSDAIFDLVEKLSKGQRGSFVINGCAGTGKTIVAINLIYKLINAGKIRYDSSDIEYESTDEFAELYSLQNYIHEHGPLKVGFVVPMTSLRSTLKIVFADTDGLKPGIVIGPSNIEENEYDVLVVDESHRLARRKNISYLGSFDDKCREMGLEPNESSQLDWIIKGSKYQVFFYDREQSVKGSDISPEEFDSKTEGAQTYRLESQMRCLGGTRYIEYLKKIFDCTQTEQLEVEDYDFKMFDDVQELVNSIQAKDKTVGLSRTLAGYSWEWISKGMSYEDTINKHKEDISIDGHKYVWNKNATRWILSDNAVNEIGCIHTSQGYDLNYVGVIFGREIDYDEKKNEITIDRDKFFDRNVKAGTDDATLKKYIVNSYRVMMERGIRGCYVYACNKGLRGYLSRFIKHA